MEAIIQYYKPTRVREHDRYILQTEIVEVPESRYVPVYEIETPVEQKRELPPFYKMTDTSYLRKICKF